MFTKQQVALLFDILDATVERCIATDGDELRANGYTLLRGKKLGEFKGLGDVTLIKEGNRAPVIGVFSFRAVLNVAMLLTESERARQVRTRVLDIVMDVLAEKTGGQTKFINQRDDRYLTAAFQEANYRKQFPSRPLASCSMARVAKIDERHHVYVTCRWRRHKMKTCRQNRKTSP